MEKQRILRWTEKNEEANERFSWKENIHKTKGAVEDQMKSNSQQVVKTAFGPKCHLFEEAVAGRLWRLLRNLFRNDC